MYAMAWNSHRQVTGEGAVLLKLGGWNGWKICLEILVVGNSDMFVKCVVSFYRVEYKLILMLTTDVFLVFDIEWLIYSGSW